MHRPTNLALNYTHYQWYPRYTWVFKMQLKWSHPLIWTWGPFPKYVSRVACDLTSCQSYVIRLTWAVRHVGHRFVPGDQEQFCSFCRLELYVSFLFKLCNWKKYVAIDTNFFCALLISFACAVMVVIAIGDELLCFIIQLFVLGFLEGHFVVYKL